MMMVTFTKLLVMRMVASVRSESSRSAIILLSEAYLPSSNSFSSLGVNEKIAISLPEAKPDTKSRASAKINAKRAP